MKLVFDYKNFFKMIFILNIFFIFIIGFFMLDIYKKQNEIVEALDKMKKEVEEFNEPFTSESWVIDEIKNWYLDKGINLEVIYGNYIKEHNIPVGFKYVFRTYYKNHAWNVTIIFFPTNQIFAQCQVFDLQKWIYCYPSERGQELINKYNE